MAALPSVGRGLVPLTGEGLTGTGPGSAAGSQAFPSHRRPGPATAHGGQHSAAGHEAPPYETGEGEGPSQSSALGAQHSNGNGGKKNGERKPLHLRIKLERRGTDEDDVELLREAYRLLSSWNGEDSYELWIVSGREQAQLRSPRATTCFNPSLEGALKELLGHDCVTVCESEAAVA
jgi:hypothetical protein